MIFFEMQRPFTYNKQIIADRFPGAFDFVLLLNFHCDSYKFFFIKGYVPFGTPIVVGLLMPDPTLKQIIFWQWLNQRYMSKLI